MVDSVNIFPSVPFLVTLNTGGWVNLGSSHMTTIQYFINENLSNTTHRPCGYCLIKSSLWTAPRSLVYRDKISCHWVQGFPSNEGVKEGYPPKKDVILPLLARIMWKRLQIGTYMLLIVTSTGDRLFGFTNIDDLERPWTPQKRF